MWVYWERCIPRTEEWMMDNQQPNQPQYPSQTPQVPQTPQASQAYAPQAYAPQAYAPQAMPQQPVYAQPAPVQQPAVKPKKGWGKLFAALACLPLLIVGEIIGLYAGDATVLGEDLGAELGGALFAVVLCCILGGVSLLNITAKSWKWAWRGLWWSIAISAAIAILDLYDYISTDSLFPVRDWPWQFFLSIVYCIAIGFFEEFMVRGLVLQGLLSRMGTNRKGVVWACILSSLFFGLLHVDLSRIFDVTALEFLQGLLKVLQTGMYGFALAAVVCKTGEIVSAALLHGLDDWLLFVLTFVVGDSLVTEYVSSDVDEGWATVIVYVICIALYIPLVVRAAHTLRDIDVPNRGAFFRERAGVVAAPAAPAAPVAAPAAAYAASTQQGYPAQYVQPQQYVQQPQQYVQPQPYAQQPPAPQQPAVPPVNPIPTQIPDENLFQTDRSDPRNIGQ